MANDIRDFVKSCKACLASIGKTDTPPMMIRDTPEYPCQMVSVDYKGPVKGLYLHVTIDNLSCWPEVQVVKSTQFKHLKKKLESVVSLHGIPEVIVSDNGPPYNSHDWRKFAKEMGFTDRYCTPEHPEANGLAERFMSVLVKVIHTAVAEGNDPITAIRRRLLNYRNTIHPSTGKTPAEVLMGRTVRTRIPTKRKETLSKTVEEAKEKDKETRKERKAKFDKRKQATEISIKAGDKVLLKQQKKVLQPPFDPNPYEVEEVKDTRLTLKRGSRKIKRSMNKVKKVVPRPERLKKNRPGPNTPSTPPEFSDTSFDISKETSFNRNAFQTHDAPSNSDSNEVQNENLSQAENTTENSTTESPDINLDDIHLDNNYE